MKKTCDDYLNDYLLLDKNQKIPLKLSMHFLLCKDCRKIIRSLSRAEKIAAEPLKIKSPVNSQEITQIVQQIDPDYNPKKSKVSFTTWVFAGIILITSMILANILTKSISTSFLSFVTAISFVLLFCLYFFAFVQANMEFFVKKIGAKII